MLVHRARPCRAPAASLASEASRARLSSPNGSEFRAESKAQSFDPTEFRARGTSGNLEEPVPAPPNKNMRGDPHSSACSSHFLPFPPFPSPTLHHQFLLSCR
eukprot:9473486-Pyramimonas_sp.AAC.1